MIFSILQISRDREDC